MLHPLTLHARCLRGSAVSFSSPDTSHRAPPPGHRFRRAEKFIPARRTPGTEVWIWLATPSDTSPQVVPWESRAASGLRFHHAEKFAPLREARDENMGACCTLWLSTPGAYVGALSHSALRVSPRAAPGPASIMLRDLLLLGEDRGRRSGSRLPHATSSDSFSPGASVRALTHYSGLTACRIIYTWSPLLSTTGALSHLSTSDGSHRALPLVPASVMPRFATTRRSLGTEDWIRFSTGTTER